MTFIPAQVSALLQELKTQLPVMLGRNLVGIYLYGSLTQRAFKPKRSDVDLIVVTRRDLSAAQFRRLDAWLKRAREANAWAARLQMSFLIRDQVLTLCRILYSHRHGTVVSKQRAAKWALETLPARWHALIRQALASDESAQAKSLSRARIATFIEFAEAQLRAAPMGVRRRRARIGR